MVDGDNPDLRDPDPGPDPGDGAPLLVLGPLLRYVSETEATVWVETDRACQAEILGHQARTFDPDRPLRLAYGSCRIAELPVPRHRRSPRLTRQRALIDEQEHGPDAMA